MIVTNPGTAAAKNVRVTVLLPASGMVLLKPLPPGAEWNKTTQKLSWVIPNIEAAARDSGTPGKSTSTFHVRLNGMGLFRVAAEARSGELAAKDSLSTSVSGMADIDLNVVERKRVLDVNEMTVFDITLKNVGTKEAKNLLITAELKNVVPDIVGGVDADPAFDDKTGKLTFPPIASLAARRRAEPGHPREGDQARDRDLPGPRLARRYQGGRRRTRGYRLRADHARHAGEVSPGQSAFRSAASISPSTASR